MLPLKRDFIKNQFGKLSSFFRKKALKQCFLRTLVLLGPLTGKAFLLLSAQRKVSFVLLVGEGFMFTMDTHLRTIFPYSVSLWFYLTIQ